MKKVFDIMILFYY